MPTWAAILVLLAGTVVGVLATLAAGQEPGGLLGFFIIVGTVAGALCIRRGKVYLLFPAPALAFFAGAVITGKVHDSQLGSSTAGLGAGFAQWVAGIFFPAVIATIIVLLMGLARWLLGRQLVTGQLGMSTGRPDADGARPAPRRPAADEWADDQSLDGLTRRPAQPGQRPRPGASQPPRQGNGARPPAGDRPRPPRDQRADRDPWGDPRQRPGGQGAKPPASARPSFNPNRSSPRSSPQRPPRRPPPDDWN